MHHENETVTNLPNQAEVGGGRRRWIGQVIALAVAAPFAVLVKVFSTSTANKFSTTVSLGAVADVFAASDWREMQVLGRPVLVTQTNNTIVAYLLKCTHAGCPLTVNANRIVCHCHGGTFSMQGQPTGGPPKHPLTKLECKVTAGVLYVRIVEGG